MSEAHPLLNVAGIKVSFAGVKAADNVTLAINQGDFTAIIGANGSGKTTFLNICTGYVKPQSGKVFLEGRDITALPPRQIARQGIARSFQIPQLFTDHTVRENLMLSIAAREGIFQGFRSLDRPAYRAEADELMALVGLAPAADTLTGALPEGLRKLADVTLALALRPRVLLLDEPTSGVSALERFEIMETLMNALRERNTSALFVEHDMDVVRRYADRVLVWDTGQVIADGLPDVVFAEEKVIKSVLGAI